MYDLQRFGLTEMIHSGRELRNLGAEAQSMDQAAAEIVNLFYECFRNVEGTPNCALVRCFKTHPYLDLPRELQDEAAQHMKGASVPVALQCLCLLASRGQRPEWNDHAASAGHRAIPLLSPETVAEAPMIARMFQQMGVGVDRILAPAQDQGSGHDLLVDADGQHFNVFHIEQALGSEYVPAQETFVRPYGIQSVIGFGGVLPSQELFAFVIFSKVRIARDTAELFRTLALGAKLVLLPFAGRRVFVQ
jgi:hypothetical protein